MLSDLRGKESRVFKFYCIGYHFLPTYIHLEPTDVSHAPGTEPVAPPVPSAQTSDINTAVSPP